MRLKAIGTATFALSILLAPAAIGHAQVRAQVLPPPPGFVPPYEIMRTVRAVGLDPLAPPLREGTTYVLRATDYRGILMRVVVDANTGTIRAVNRIVPAPVMPGQIRMMPPPHAATRDDVLPPYGPPPEFDTPPRPPNAQAALPPPPFASRSPAAKSAAHSNLPLPRPRPAALASSKPDNDAQAETAGPTSAPSASSAPRTVGQGAEQKPEVKPDVSATAAPPAKATPRPPVPPIND